MAEGQKLAFDRSKGNCLTCHAIKGGTLPGSIGPLGALRALRARAIRVPEDVALVGFDDVDATEFANPPLTTVRQPLREQGARAAELVLAALRGDDVPERVVSTYMKFVTHGLHGAREELAARPRPAVRRGVSKTRR